eukprot:GHVT01068430.1.p1 GENE.GHVT01068430.1~~GHVT01068430.1.p1  ORF type:complete len:133 (-),score=17.25 GHVT01068430.1:33-431(-)
MVQEMWASSRTKRLCQGKNAQVTRYGTMNTYHTSLYSSAKALLLLLVQMMLVLAYPELCSFPPVKFLPQTGERQIGTSSGVLQDDGRGNPTAAEMGLPPMASTADDGTSSDSPWVGFIALAWKGCGEVAGEG